MRWYHEPEASPPQSFRKWDTVETSVGASTIWQEVVGAQIDRTSTNSHCDNVSLPETFALGNKNDP
jgi:hypothetical protein